MSVRTVTATKVFENIVRINEIIKRGKKKKKKKKKTAINQRALLALRIQLSHRIAKRRNITHILLVGIQPSLIIKQLAI